MSVYSRDCEYSHARGAPAYVRVLFICGHNWWVCTDCFTGLRDRDDAPDWPWGCMHCHGKTQKKDLRFV